MTIYYGILLTYVCAFLLTSCSSKIDSNSLSDDDLYTIAYSSSESGDTEIYLIDSEAKSKIRITDRPGNDGYVAWSPDGKRIAAYAYHDGRKTWSIHTLNRDGTNRKRLTHAQNKWDSSPAWSPDGSKIAFGRAYSDTAGVWQEEIWIMNADGSGQAQIKSLSGGGPYFTPDGRLLFHSKTQTSEIYIADMDGSNLTQLTHNEAEDWHPEVSSDGRYITFMSDRDGNHEIYVMNIDGSNQQRLTFNDVRDSTPSWSPDGSQIIFRSSDADENSHIYIMNKDGSSLKKFIPNASGAVWFKKRTRITERNSSSLELSYFDQEPPGLTPQVFAPGTVSIDGRYEGGISFSPDLNELYFGATNENDKTHIYFSKRVGSTWTPIEKVNFTNGRKEEERHPFVSPDGKRIYFAAHESESPSPRIWYVDRLEDSRGEAVQLDSPMNDGPVFYANQSKNGDLYYFDISTFKTHYAPNQNGTFGEPQPLDIEFGHHAFISPDGDYVLVTDRHQEDENRTDNDIYVYFKQGDGTWTKPINLGAPINSNRNEKTPSITPDGKYLFFGRDERDTEPGLGNIHWVSTEVIERLRPDDLD